MAVSNFRKFGYLPAATFNSAFLYIDDQQELHEAGRTFFYLPGAKIPEWFDFQTSEFPISFWFRNKFPAIAICHIIKRVAEFSSSRGWTFRPNIRTKVIINGNANLFIPVVLGSDCSCLFDLRGKRVTDNLDEALLENEWNHAEVTCPGFTFTFAPTFIKTGLHVLKQATTSLILATKAKPFSCRELFVDREIENKTRRSNKDKASI